MIKKLVPCFVASLFLFLCSLTFSGCTNVKAPESPTVSSNIGGARALGQYALKDVTTLKAHVDPNYEPTRHSAETALTDQDAKLAAAEKGQAAANAALSKANNDLSAEKQALKDEQGHWIGYQLRLWGKIVITTAVLGWLALGSLSMLTPMGGWGSTLVRLLPFTNIFAWIRDKFIHPPASTPVDGGATQPPKD